MGLYAREKVAAFTADGDTAGLGTATIASTVGFCVGADAWITSDTEAPARCVIESVVSSTVLGIRIKSFRQAPFQDIEIPSYGRSSLAIYDLADNARIFQEAGVVPNVLHFG